MYEGEIDPRYQTYYRKAHEERAQAFRDALAWLFGRDRTAHNPVHRGAACDA